MERREPPCLFVIQVHVCLQNGTNPLRHHVSCNLSSPSEPLKLCLFSFSLTGRSCTDPQVYWFPYKGITQSNAEASVECWLFFCLLKKNKIKQSRKTQNKTKKQQTLGFSVCACLCEHHWISIYFNMGVQNCRGMITQSILAWIEKKKSVVGEL